MERTPPIAPRANEPDDFRYGTLGSVSSCAVNVHVAQYMQGWTSTQIQRVEQRHEAPLTFGQISGTSDENIDSSDAAELDKEFWGGRNRIV